MANILRENLPPKCDYVTYLNIIETHLTAEIVPTLNEILQDPVLTQNIGWDLIHLLLPIPDSEACLTTIARVGNPREVILKVTEALQLLELSSDEVISRENSGIEPTDVEKFCTLIKLLSILYPRIKTKHPSRFLSTSLRSILAKYRPLHQATLAVISLLHSISEKKSFILPENSLCLGRQIDGKKTDVSIPDLEVQDEEAKEEAIQTKLIQSFITYVLEKYVDDNSLDWAARLLERLYPQKVIDGRSIGKAFEINSELQKRDIIIGHFVAISRDFGLTNYDTLFGIIFSTDTPLAYENLEDYDNFNLGDIPLSRVGSLLLAISLIFPSIIVKSKFPVPQLSLFPDHARLVKTFISNKEPELITEKRSGVIDAILALGLWLENKNRFVSGPLEDEGFLEYLQSISLLSANTQLPSLRYAAHTLCSSVLHAHPLDRVRLAFIADTLENCPYETLKASAVFWLKEEIISTCDRNSNNIFGNPSVLAATQPFLFPATSEILNASNEELVEEINSTYPFYMAVLNFLIFLCGKQYCHILPAGMLDVVKNIYIRPLKTVCENILDKECKNLTMDADSTMVQFQLLEEQIKLCLTDIDRLITVRDQN